MHPFLTSFGTLRVSSRAVNSSSKVASSASISRLESDTFLLTVSLNSGDNLARRTGESRAP